MPRDRPRLELHKALADDTRYRLYRYIGLASRPVSVREMSQRLSLHPNTLRPHLRRLEEAGLVSPEVRKTATVGRPQTLYSIREPEGESPGELPAAGRDALGLVRGKRADRAGPRPGPRVGRVPLGQGAAPPGVTTPPGPEPGRAPGGHGPRPGSTRGSGGLGREASRSRSGPARSATSPTTHRELVCTLHRGLIEGMLSGLTPPCSLTTFQPLVERGHLPAHRR